MCRDLHHIAATINESAKKGFQKPYETKFCA